MKSQGFPQKFWSSLREGIHNGSTNDGGIASRGGAVLKQCHPFPPAPSNKRGGLKSQGRRKGWKSAAASLSASRCDFEWRAPISILCLRRHSERRVCCGTPWRSNRTWVCCRSPPHACRGLARHCVHARYANLCSIASLGLVRSAGGPCHAGSLWDRTPH